MKKICVFCGSNTGYSDVYIHAAKALAEAIVDHKLQLVYGGGKVGLMGIIADEVLNQGGVVTGVIPHFLAEKEVGHDHLTEMIVVNSMHERKQKMAELADGFIAQPGGFGTLEELAEILTWVQLGIIEKPVGLYNVSGFYKPLCQQLDLMVSEGFLNDTNRKLLLEEEHPNQLIENMKNFEIPIMKKWFTPSQT